MHQSLGSRMQSTCMWPWRYRHCNNTYRWIWWLIWLRLKRGAFISVRWRVNCVIPYGRWRSGVLRWISHKEHQHTCDKPCYRKMCRQSELLAVELKIFRFIRTGGDYHREETTIYPA